MITNVVRVDLPCRWKKPLLWKMNLEKEMLAIPGLEKVGFSSERHDFLKNTGFGRE